MADTVKDTIKSRQIAILAANGVNESSLNTMVNKLAAAGAQAKIVAPKAGQITGDKGTPIKVDKSAAQCLFCNVRRGICGRRRRQC